MLVDHSDRVGNRHPDRPAHLCTGICPCLDASGTVADPWSALSQQEQQSEQQQEQQQVRLAQRSLAMSERWGET